MTLISTVTDLRVYCSTHLAAFNPLYRGQTKEYAQILPSLYRPGCARPVNAQELVVELYMDAYRLGDWTAIRRELDEEFEKSFNPIGGSWLQWHTDWGDASNSPILSDEWPPQGGPGENYTREDLVLELRESFRNNYAVHGDALLQHYGLPSPALDVTFELMVALWFATHPYVEDGSGKAEHVDAMGTSPGVIYIFDAAKVVDLVDLRKAHNHPYDPGGESIPYFGLRGIAQHGALLFGATAAQPDMSRCVVDQISVAPDIWATLTPSDRWTWSYQSLLPAPTSDLFYAHLLALKRRGGERFAAILKAVREYK